MEEDFTKCWIADASKDILLTLGPNFLPPSFQAAMHCSANTVVETGGITIDMIEMAKGDENNVEPRIVTLCCIGRYRQGLQMRANPVTGEHIKQL